VETLRSHWAPPDFIVKVGIPTETDH
jgi:hypothetical protein